MLASSQRPRGEANIPGGYRIRPYGRRQGPATKRESVTLRSRNPCRGRCLHRPGSLATSRGLREGHGPPLQAMANVWPGGKAAALRANVGRDALIPPGLRRREHPGFESPRCGGRERPPYGAGQPPRPPANPALPQGSTGGINPTPTANDKPRSHPVGRNFRVSTPPVGADSISARFAAARGSAGGYGIRPYGRRQGPRLTEKM